MSSADWFEASADIEPFDVRPILARKQHPLAEVLARSAAVPPDGFLVVDASFDPGPLRRRLAMDGFPSVARQLGPGHWRIVFQRTSSSGSPFPTGDIPVAGQADMTACAEGGLWLDLRDLEPPEPLLRILEYIDGGNHAPLVVRLKRDPLLLYPELAERGWTWSRLDADIGEICLRLEPVAI